MTAEPLTPEQLADLLDKAREVAVDLDQPPWNAQVVPCNASDVIDGLIATVEARDAEVRRLTEELVAARLETEDLRWLVGWFAKNVVRAVLPPRLVPLVIEAKRDMSWSKYTVAGPYDLARTGETTDD